MPKAGEVAIKLRRIADALDADADTVIVKPTLSFHPWEKEAFLALAAIFPRPYTKGDGWNHSQITLTHDGNAVEVYAAIDRSRVCTIKVPAQPAIYDCEPSLLSQAEEQHIDLEA